MDAVDRIGPDEKVTIRYVMTSHYPDGTQKKHPEKGLTFIFGVERQPPSLEAALKGAVRGQRIHVFIPPAEVFGEHDASLVREIPKGGLIKQRLREGQFYRQMKRGSLVSFKVLEVREDAVVADFNKPMAGIGVSMDVEVQGVEKARPEEIVRAMEAAAKKDNGCG